MNEMTEENKNELLKNSINSSKKSQEKYGRASSCVRNYEE